MIVQNANEPEQRFNNEIPPPNYMVWAILSTLFCCIPLGIVSIVKASEVNTKWIAGDRIGAIKSSQQAKNWAIASMFSILIIVFIYLFFAFFTVIFAVFVSILES